MSYDLAAFELSAAPTEPKAFVEWYSERMESDDYADPAPGSPLSRWASLMRRVFTDEDDAQAGLRTADYSSTYADLVYLALAWSDAREGRDLAFQAASIAGVGIFTLSDDAPAVYVLSGSEMRLRFAL